ncbi:acetyl-CoA carboxylase biotin carboxylase subunit family protein [Streptomyces sp. NPDC086989]|uniref:ATP-grasp domain-containing protein n=1 Tax=Streptomyces sp. NPDC086989 TaxID=3365764 RepID=UPI003814D4B1
MPYDKGAVHPAEMAGALGDVAEIVYGVADSEHARRLEPVMAALGRTVALTGGREADRRAVEALDVDGVVTFSERMIRTAGWLSADLGLPGPGAAAAEAVTDKSRQRDLMRAGGVDTTRSAVIASGADWDAAVAAVGLPAVLKPARGGGSRETHPVTDAQEGRRLLARVQGAGEPFVLEELLLGRDHKPFGDYVSVESLVLDGTPHHFAVTGKFPLAAPFREVGQFWPSPLGIAETDAVLDLVTAALRAIGFGTGVTHTELKLTPGGPRVIEVNGRLGGHISELARRAAGLDAVRMAGTAALGDTSTPSPVPTSGRVYWQYNNPAPRERCELQAVLGWRETLRIKGVTAYTPYLRPGAGLPGGVMTEPLDLVAGDAADHDEMFAQLAEAGRTLSYSFTFADGERTISMGCLSDA